MDDPIQEIKSKIAYAIYKERLEMGDGGDRDGNWNEACKIVTHFLQREPESNIWKEAHSDYSRWEPYIYGKE